MDIFDVIKTAAAAGADGIEIWGQAPHIPDPSDTDHVAKIHEAMATNGLAAPQFGSYARANSVDFMEKINADLKVTAALSAPAMRIWAGAKDSEVTSLEEWNEVISDVKEACAIAADIGLIITLERHPNTVTNSVWGCQRLLDEVGSPALRVNYQVIDTDAETIAEEIRILAPHILNTHATNARTVDGKRFSTELSDGDTNWASLIDALKANGNDGFVEIEFVRRGFEEISLEETAIEMAKDIAFLKECMS